MPDLRDGEWVEVAGSARLPYVLKHLAGVYSCTCPAWRHQSLPIERRSCKHLRHFRGAAAEQARLGGQAASGETNVTAEAVPQSPPVSRPPLLLAETWTDPPDQDPRGWWLSEKLDGVRAYWDGVRLVSRQGHRFHAPDWFLERLPRVPLDGELWLGRGRFQRTLSVVRRQDRGPGWREVSYRVFDAPALAEPFERRQEALASLLAEAALPWVQPLAQERCRGRDHLRAALARVEAAGGEGLMLRQPGSPYVAGRSSTLLKVKRFHDAEARVLAHLPGAGRHRGRLGALLVALPDGPTFAVGSGFTDAERALPPPVGATITFRYQELSTRGVPRFPTFVRQRADAS